MTNREGAKSRRIENADDTDQTDLRGLINRGTLSSIGIQPVHQRHDDRDHRGSEQHAPEPTK